MEYLVRVLFKDASAAAGRTIDGNTAISVPIFLFSFAFFLSPPCDFWPLPAQLFIYFYIMS